MAVEIHGGTWTNGYHTRGKGFANDCEKRNYAQMAGWTVFEFTTDDVKNSTVALGWVEGFLKMHAPGRLGAGA